MIPASSEREAHRQVAVRAANEQSVLAVLAADPLAATLEISCECGDAGCSSTLRAPRDAYEAARTIGSRFVIIDTHENPELSHVVAVTAGVAVIDTIGVEARRIVLGGDDAGRRSRGG